MNSGKSSSNCAKLHHGGEDHSEYGEVPEPILLLISSNTEEDTWNFYNIAEDRVLDMQRVERRDYYVHKATISADPILNPNECVVVVIYENLFRMAFMRLKDKTWTYKDDTWTAVEEVVNVEDKFYAVNNYSQLLSFEITRFSGTEATVAATGMARNYVFRSYLVDSDDGLLMVQRVYEWDVDKCVTKKFKIFQLNCSKNGWIEKNTLGEYALFIGDNSTISVLASKFKNCEPNCIYFNQDDNRIKSEIGSHGPHDFSVYNFKSEEISKPYTINAMTLLEMTKRSPIWITPPPN
uniref:putative F-box protein At5g55150 n=1 Tax=Fragaria vesca subsp. vesca TaxID=101020 RepID=UPI0005C88A34|nr:PREDICTED: putative F-box protein At5g55150 [Fragaria vesca subsp. vesca]